MATNVYEGLFILDPNRYARDQSGVSEEVNKLLEDAGSNVMVSRLWDERRLAYPIKNHRRGAYWITYFEMDGTKLDGVNRQCQINDNILRHMFVKLDPRVADALIAHAQGVVAAGEAEAESEAVSSEGS